MKWFSLVSAKEKAALVLSFAALVFSMCAYYAHEQEISKVSEEFNVLFLKKDSAFVEFMGRYESDIQHQDNINKRLLKAKDKQVIVIMEE